MKKLIIFLVIGVFLAIPFAASAGSLGTGTLNVSWSFPYGGGYYTDYDGKVASSFGYSTDWEEIFCVSHDNANGTELVKFYTINADLNSLVAGLYDKMIKAAWIADNWTSYITNTMTAYDIDVLKGEAQKAVWKVMGVMDIIGSDGTDKLIYNEVLDYFSKYGNYSTSNWVYAYSSTSYGDYNYQDYLTPMSSVPEPTQMLLFGTGLIALAGIGRKRFLKK